MIVVVTAGDALRYERLALRAREELGERVGAWFVADRREAAAGEPAAKRDSLGAKVVAEWRRGGMAGIAARVPSAARKLGRNVGRLRAEARRHGRGTDVERALFAAEVEQLRSRVVLAPARIDAADLGARLEGAELVLAMEAPPIAARPLLLAEGPDAAAWALYHRRLDRCCATVRDGDGRIVRRSTPTLLPSDTPESCLLRVSALAAELLVDAARDWLAGGRGADPRLEALQADGPLPPPLLLDVERDFANGWLERELRRARSF